VLSNQGSYRFWNVMRVENDIFQDLESFIKGPFFQNGYGQVLDFYLEEF